MKRDTLFYRLFAQAPNLLSDLVPNPPKNAQSYRFDSVAVKDSQFEIDGVFLPPTDTVGTIYFCEFQMQYDPCLYERGFAESSLYFYRNYEAFSDWQMIFIYPSHKIEQKNLYPHRSLLNGEQVHRIYLDELGDIQQLPLWVGLLVLTSMEKDDETIAKAEELLARAKSEATSESESRVIIDMVTTIIWYRFETLERQEIEAMLNIATKETRLYKEGQIQMLTGQLTKQFGKLPESMRYRIDALPTSLVEKLGLDFLDFSKLTDVQNWLDNESK